MYTVYTLYKNTLATMKKYSYMMSIPLWYKDNTNFMGMKIENIFLYSVRIFLYSIFLYGVYVLDKSESWSKLRAITYVNLTYYTLWVANKSIHYCGIRLRFCGLSQIGSMHTFENISEYILRM